ncbi:MAG: hypothetical protein Q7W45_03465 [Bacteroidota bacterium]|nr:hypothetical protein [Bacteroidota bacterium]MDP3143862.1 hypothetical protein [Bacteroidota bacterium]
MKFIFKILFLTVILFAFSTCKKASSKPVNLAGEWVSFSNCQMGFVINKDNSGSYKSYNNKKGCGVKDWDGDFYITNTQLRLEKTSLFGSITFRFIEKPKLFVGNDSISSWSLTGDEKSLATRKIIATMTLKNPGTYNNEKIKYYKIIEY